ncbi:MAG: hypothetical protein JO069_01470 [Verrucomicrobia bacterium]|nr:hypothetical protein [Verrucomicrobiota bacterium]
MARVNALMSFAADTALESLDAPDFDLAKTLDSGQVFHWRPHGPGFAGAVRETPVYAEQRGSELRVTAGEGARLTHYFALDHPMADILASFPDDDTLRAAVDFSRGLRIIRQPPWECLATFLTSALKQVPHIQTISLAIRRRFGRRLDGIQGAELYAYPSPCALAAASLDTLLDCKLGFRARNLLAAARMVAHGELDLDSLNALPVAEARARLCRVPGVGPKIANCVLLFAYERLEVVPVDVWIHRVVSQTYLPSARRTPESHVQSFSETFFGPYAGYAQQFLFHHWRMTYRRGQ